MSDTFNELFADISNEIGVDDDKLSKLAEYAQEQAVLQQRINELEQEAKNASKELEKLKTEIIPDFMDEIGIESFTTTNGYEIKVEPFYRASIPKDRKDEAFSWLTQRGFDDIIKVSVSFSFGKSQYNEAVELCNKLNELGYPTLPELNVHPMTLKAWVRNMAEEGNEFPLDLFGAFIGRTTKLK